MHIFCCCHQVDGGSVSPPSPSSSQPKSPISDNNKYVLMNKIKGMEISADQEDDEYLVMQPSPVHLPLQMSAFQLDFHPSVDESQLPEPIIPNAEELRHVLYSQAPANARADVRAFDPLVDRSPEVMMPGSPGAAHQQASTNLHSASSSADIGLGRNKPQPLPRHHKCHYAGYPSDMLDTSSEPMGLQLGQLREEPSAQLLSQVTNPSSESSSSTSTTSLSPEWRIGYQQQYSRQPQPLPRQPRSPPPQGNTDTSGGVGMSHTAEQLKTLCGEFPDLDSWTCQMALQKHGGNLECAREEVKVKQLMDMGFKYIDKDDCRRALSHCQGKMERAAMWLMEQSDTIARRT